MAEGSSQKSTFIIIGGGIAGVSCAEHLSFLCPKESITLITASDMIKAVVNLKQHGRHLEEFDVEEKPMGSLCKEDVGLRVVMGAVKSFNPTDHSVSTSDGRIFYYRKLCICAGGRPKLIDTDNPNIIGIRDTQSIKDFTERLANARRVVIVGNGGIAMELVYELSDHEVVWAIKDDAIGRLFDKGAATFFLPHLETDNNSDEGRKCMQAVVKRMKYGIEDKGSKSTDNQDSSGISKPCGGALGPDWSSGLHLHGRAALEHAHKRRVHLEYECEVARILKPEELTGNQLKDLPFPNSLGTELSEKSSTVASAAQSWPLYVQLTNGKVYGCDFVVSATGVLPNVDLFTSCAEFDLAEDGGIKVDDNMRTNIPDVYAAGDVCNASWDLSKFWFQMRLWSQARQMGAFAARCMDAHVKGEETPLDFCFELFAHVTQFFGYKVVLLGKFNAQGLGNDYELLLRCTKGMEYIKVVLHNGRMHGAVLIGETDLEETFENLILNEMDLSQFGESLLDPRIDIEDFFD